MGTTTKELIPTSALSSPNVQHFLNFNSASGAIRCNNFDKRILVKKISENKSAMCKMVYSHRLTRPISDGPFESAIVSLFFAYLCCLAASIQLFANSLPIFHSAAVAIGRELQHLQDSCAHCMVHHSKFLDWESSAWLVHLAKRWVHGSKLKINMRRGLQRSPQIPMLGRSLPPAKFVGGCKGDHLTTPLSHSMWRISKVFLERVYGTALVI